LSARQLGSEVFKRSRQSIEILFVGGLNNGLDVLCDVRIIKHLLPQQMRRTPLEARRSVFAQCKTSCRGLSENFTQQNL
jgi:hypothetical protein